jgi:hypothetical protein
VCRVKFLFKFFVAINGVTAVQMAAVAVFAIFLRNCKLSPVQGHTQSLISVRGYTILLLYLRFLDLYLIYCSHTFPYSVWFMAGVHYTIPNASILRPNRQPKQNHFMNVLQIFLVSPFCCSYAQLLCFNLSSIF